MHRDTILLEPAMIIAPPLLFVQNQRRAIKSDEMSASIFLYLPPGPACFRGGSYCRRTSLLFCKCLSSVSGIPAHECTISPSRLACAFAVRFISTARFSTGVVLSNSKPGLLVDWSTFRIDLLIDGLESVRWSRSTPIDFGWGGSLQLVELLHRAHAIGCLDVEVQASYDPATNIGKLAVEVILLPSVRGWGRRVGLWALLLMCCVSVSLYSTDEAYRYRAKLAPCRFPVAGTRHILGTWRLQPLEIVMPKITSVGSASPRLFCTLTFALLSYIIHQHKVHILLAVVSDYLRDLASVISELPQERQ